MTTSIRLGSALGVVIFGAVFSYFVPQKNPIQNGIDIATVLTGFKAAFLFGSAIAIAGLYFVISKDKIKTERIN